MKSFNNSNFNSTYQRRTFTNGNAMNSSNNYNGKVETQLLPNEIRISTKGSFNAYIHTILSTLEDGYKNCKIVGRGIAAQTAVSILQVLKKKAPQHYYQQETTQALNKQGNVVDEIHILVTNRDRQNAFKSRNSPYQGNSNQFRSQNIGGQGRFTSNGTFNDQRRPPMMNNYGDQQQRRPIMKRSPSPVLKQKTSHGLLNSDMNSNIRPRRVFRDDNDVRPQRFTLHYQERQDGRPRQQFRQGEKMTTFENSNRFTPNHSSGNNFNKGPREFQNNFNSAGHFQRKSGGMNSHNGNNYPSKGMTNSRGDFNQRRDNHYSHQNGPYPIKPSSNDNSKGKMITTRVNMAEKENRSDNIGLAEQV